MGDRFYQAQKEYKPGKKLKADHIAEFQDYLGSDIAGLEKLTIKTIEELTEALVERLQNN